MLGWADGLLGLVWRGHTCFAQIAVDRLLSASFVLSLFLSSWQNSSCQTADQPDRLRRASPDPALPDQARKGRDGNRREDMPGLRPLDDGWACQGITARMTKRRLRTTVAIDANRSIISPLSNKSPDIPFEQSINPYRGCEHGCLFCAAEPMPFSGHSPGLDLRASSKEARGGKALLEAEPSPVTSRR